MVFTQCRKREARHLLACVVERRRVDIAFTGVVLFTMASNLSQQTGSSFARLASCVSLVGGRGWHEEKLMVM